MGIGWSLYITYTYVYIKYTSYTLSIYFIAIIIIIYFCMKSESIVTGLLLMLVTVNYILQLYLPI